MFRNLLRRGIPALVLTLVLAGAAPAAAAQSSGFSLWEGVWRWAASLWLDGGGIGTGTGDRGPGADPNGSTSQGDRGLGADPNGSTSDGDRGLGLDPNG